MPRTARRLLAALAAPLALAALASPAVAEPDCDMPGRPICQGPPLRGNFTVAREPDPTQQRGPLRNVVSVWLAADLIDAPVRVIVDGKPIDRAYDGDGLTVIVPSEARRICVSAGEPLRPIDGGCKDVRVNPFGALDAVSPMGGEVRVHGWAVDPETSSAIGVHVYVDGQFAGAAQADQAAPHMNPKDTSIWGMRHGYELTLPMRTDPGEHRVCAYALNTGSGGNAELGCGTYGTPRQTGSKTFALKRDSWSFSYSAPATADPEIPANAIITAVRNTSKHSYDVTHESVTKTLALGAMTTGFNGQRVLAGAWTGKVLGWFPPGDMSVTVEWSEP